MSDPSGDVPPGAPSNMTKLFTLSGDSIWTEIGVGNARLAQIDDDECDEETFATPLRLIIESNDSAEVLLSTPISPTDDIYAVQRGTVLVWSDPELLRDMAASFQSPEGCAEIYDGIIEYQRKHQRFHSPLSEDSQAGLGATGHSPWDVCPENLKALALAIETNKSSFIYYLVNNEECIHNLQLLFRQCVATGDEESRRQIESIVVALLSPPFSHDHKILSQLVAVAKIDATVDIVQSHLRGGPDPALGFVSLEDRVARHRMPIDLSSDEILPRIRYIVAIQWLRDLLPVALDEGDAGCNNPLSMFMLRQKFELFTQVCDKNTLGTALRRSMDRLTDSSNKDVMREFVTEAASIVPFLHELSASCKNTMFPPENKEELFNAAVGNGLVPFLAASLDAFCSPDAEKWVGTERPLQYVVGRIGDIAAHCAMFAPTESRLALLREAWKEERGGSCLLTLIFRWMARLSDPQALQALYEAIIFSCVGLNVAPNAVATDASAELKQDIVCYLIEGRLKEPRQPLGNAEPRFNVSPTTNAPPTKVLKSPLAVFLGLVNEQRSAISDETMRFALKIVSFFVSQYCRTHSDALAKAFTSNDLCEILVRVLEESRVVATINSALAVLTSLATSTAAPLVEVLLAEPNAAASPLGALIRILKRTIRRNNMLASAARSVVSGIARTYAASHDGRVQPIGKRLARYILSHFSDQLTGHSFLREVLTLFEAIAEEREPSVESVSSLQSPFPGTIQISKHASSGSLAEEYNAMFADFAGHPTTSGPLSPPSAAFASDDPDSPGGDDETMQRQSSVHQLGSVRLRESDGNAGSVANTPPAPEEEPALKRPRTADGEE